MSSFLGGIGSFLGGAARLIPGDMNGYRQGIQDNWSDMTNYNNVQKGQISNLFDMATFEDDVTRANMAAENARLGTLRNTYDMGLYFAGYPGQLEQQMAFSQFAPMMFPLLYGNQLGQLMYNGAGLFGGNPAFRLPSNIGG